MWWPFCKKTFVHAFTGVTVRVKDYDDEYLGDDHYVLLLYRKGSKRICKIKPIGSCFGSKNDVKGGVLYRTVIIPWLAGHPTILYDTLIEYNVKVTSSVISDVCEALFALPRK